ncbi:MAG: UvrD-helicase domain-containing protein [Coriobacteriaceae bacterium]|jgi:ATP-dependent exoDNAse (exonuclease V) beta subunit|nr:UvrD-helicase domain-containing protein [Coriobacteriaceae bacterium]
MRLDSLTEGQRQAVTRVQGPLFIAAGAGSGKTHTLTQRIAYALLHPQESGVEDIGAVLAITFTEKAAGEIKARVKNVLRQEGMVEQALKVDGAWISTIHGMCSRILRAHALELRLDPGFGIISDVQRDDLLTESINEALGKGTEVIGRSSYARLFDEFAPRSFGYGASSVDSMLKALLDKAATLKGGLDDVSFGPSVPAPQALARELLAAFADLMPLLSQAGKSSSAEQGRIQAADAQEQLQSYLQAYPVSHGEAASCPDVPRSPSPLEETTQGIPREDHLQHLDAPSRPGPLEAFAQLLDSLALIPCRFGNAEVKAAIKGYQAVHRRIVAEAVIGLAAPAAEELLALAREVQAIYEAKKRCSNVLDNDDLLLKTLFAFDAHSDIAQAYEQRFKMVMVDEFQDTSQIQIDLIEQLAGPRSARLCTVGDAQQSIYRFRGADVKVYEAHKKSMHSPQVGALAVELSQNFRSHQDVLSLVDCVFGQPQVFGDAFMSLKPDKARNSRFLGQGPRVDLALVTRPSQAGTGLTSAHAVMAEAVAIASRFSQLAKEGHEPKDMVVLLGKMSNAVIYAQALRDAGFECVVTGGSLFSQAPEVNLMARLLEMLANPLNTAALFEVLASELFLLTADDFLGLSTAEDPEGGEWRRCNLYQGFARLAFGTPDEAAPQPERLRCAARVLRRAWEEVGKKPACALIEQVLLESGCLSRCEGRGVDGLAWAGNVFKALRMIERIEKESGFGIAQTAKAFANQLAFGIKEAPGALSGEGSQAIRIMTIHASKGLEFPLVALAALSGSLSDRGKLALEAGSGKAYASLALGEGLERYPGLKKQFTGFGTSDDHDEAPSTELLANAATGAAFRAALRSYAAAEELAEARRKLYVGLTRASEALIIALSVKIPAKDPLAAYRGVVDDIRQALCGEDDFPWGVAELPFGGTRPARFERIELSRDTVLPCSEAGNRAQGNGLDLWPTSGGTSDAPLALYRRTLREGVFSYSSLASAAEQELPGPQGKKGKPAQEGSLPSDGRGAQGIAPAIGRPVLTDGRACDTGEKTLEGAGWKGEEDEGIAWSEEDEGYRGRRKEDSDKASELGSAFHRLAQFEAETGQSPSDKRIKALSDAFRLSEAQGLRLRKSLATWFGSGLHAKTQGFERRRAEMPFFIALDGLAMEGEMDLFCSNEAQEDALIIDFKTGGSAHEAIDALVEKHRLQASCYALVALEQGYKHVEAVFVRVEHPQGPSVPHALATATAPVPPASPGVQPCVTSPWPQAEGCRPSMPEIPQAPEKTTAPSAYEPQTVAYSFTADDREGLRSLILAAAGRLR